MNAKVDEFLQQLETVPWFTNLGKPIPRHEGAKQIRSWEEWPGPEDDAISEMSYHQQGLYDEIMENAREDRRLLESLWNKIDEKVVAVARNAVPYDPNRDSYYGPNLAVWHAAWTAGLIGLYLRLGKPIPPELQVPWEWFVRGHWPFSLQTESPKETLVIF